jgi:electron transport complex protein RnfD
MVIVLLALLPGIVAATWIFGTGVLTNLAMAAAIAVCCEAVCVWLRRQPLTRSLTDGSALVTGVLLALALPPGISPLLIALGVTAALVLGKHVYGGLGANLFNPAMVGYALLLVSFPADLVNWPQVATAGVDQLTGATALDTFKHRGGATVAEIWTPMNGFGRLGAAGWEVINAGYLLGGIALVSLRIVDWRMPVATLGSLALLSALNWSGGGSASLGAPFFHLFSGATMLGAFFIATDPVTCPTSARGRWLFGGMVGVLVFVVRSFASYPDGVAFAVLLANAAAPWLDRMPLRTVRPA